MTEQFSHQSGYVYADNDPVGKIDFMGLSGETTGQGHDEFGKITNFDAKQNNGVVGGSVYVEPTISARRTGGVGLQTENHRWYDSSGNSANHNLGDTRTFDMNENDPYGVLHSSPFSLIKGGLTREEVYTGYGQWKPTSEFGYVERQKFAASLLIGGPATGKALSLAGSGITYLRYGGQSFRAYKAARGGGGLVGNIRLNAPHRYYGTSFPVRIEYSHRWITQAMQRRHNLPNWLVNNRLNAIRTNTLRHAGHDPFRYRFLPREIKLRLGQGGDLNFNMF